MKSLTLLSHSELLNFENEAKERYNVFLKKPAAVNMTRGKPSPEQLRLSDELFSLPVSETGFMSEDGTDCRNYGALCGIDECRRLFGEIFGVDKSNVIACGSSSLNLMYDYISQGCCRGIAGCEPWLNNKNRKFIAVVPGYDRHFSIAEYLGFELLSVHMDKNGPDMDEVEYLIKNPDVKGMFCVPKYSNPNGVTYSPGTIERLAAMKPAAADFRVIWDEAYIVHDIFGEGDTLENIFEKASKYGNEDNFIAFASTSKITYAGAGVSAVAASQKNIKEIAGRLANQIISYDKMNQLRHCYIFKSLADVKSRMKQHAEFLRPKFETVLGTLDRELSGLGIAEWSKPKGGYFISLDILTGSAGYVGELCRKAGVVLTEVGATFPYGIDPEDKNIRIAPSCPSLDELKAASEIICLAVKLAACKYIREAQEKCSE